MEIKCRFIVLFWTGISFVMFYLKVINYEGEYATIMVKDTKKVSLVGFFLIKIICYFISGGLSLSKTIKLISVSNI